MNTIYYPLTTLTYNYYILMKKTLLLILFFVCTALCSAVQARVGMFIGYDRVADIVDDDERGFRIIIRMVSSLPLQTSLISIPRRLQPFG